MAEFGCILLDGAQRITSHVLYMQAIWCLSEFSKEHGGELDTHPIFSIKSSFLVVISSIFV